MGGGRGADLCGAGVAALSVDSVPGASNAVVGPASTLSAHNGKQT